MNISSEKRTGKVALLWGELGHVLLHVDDAHVGAVLLGDAEELHNALVVLDVAIDQNEQELALEVLGGGGVVGEDGVEVGGGLGGEEEIVLLQVTTEDLGGGLVGELVDKGQLLLLDEAGKGLSTLSLEVDTSLVELQIKNFNKVLGSFPENYRKLILYDLYKNFMTSLGHA